MKMRRTLAALVSVAALTLSACGGSDGSSGSGSKLEVSPDGSYNKQDRENLAQGGELTLPIDELSEQQNDFHADFTAYTRTIWQWYNPVLFTTDGDGTYHTNPDYLTDAKEETVDGNTRVTYTINPKAQFNDGTPIDWKVFEHTWQFMNGSNKELNVSSTDGYERVTSVRPGENDRQVVVTYNGVYPWWQGIFGELLHPAINSPEIFNKAYIGKLHPEWGAGPFTVDNVDFHAGVVSFKPNDKWWGNKPLLDKVTYRYMEDQASINAFKAGEIDATRVSSKDRLAVAKGMGDQAKIYTALRPANVLIMLNGQSPELNDVHVREAVMTAIDRAQLADIRFNGLDYTEQLPGSFNLLPTQEGYEDNFGQVVSFDPDKAKEILDQAGWAPGADGVREKDGKPLTLRYVEVGGTPMTKATAGAVQKMLKDVGIEVKVEERPSSDFSKVATQRDFDIFPMAFNMGDAFGVASFGQVYRSNSELNRSGTGTPELDKKIDELQKIGDAKGQIKKSNELEREAFHGYGIMPLANGPFITATKPGLANYGSLSFGYIPPENIGWEKK
ncbi:ABC transporter family substrate-binding protein [Corynebacterium uberis]|uniref:ABC transporter family substrate-binding protein n=1 Tax=Corynebacterium TaxID=1716 RepID=UPI001D0A375E|nr:MULTISPECIES: ABC transporter family substrate-binding protein [Corynebacterium]MCZ9308936.1 ABC transporter family substrate-binding protein [Corynebacterium sp. c6VSa_13]UDL74593.1 ABC transporter family substrate-binding protein [Corynebacterium uberis]UDL76573.1 ABC transporter family substrate-binding protein [Corynebacterium uberis]UDL78786.1 ABC transporter family substrate-binding protein [Corynebacterium uberis]UDL81064.1 ABC transporter family substrate-binding protein [Corynebact